MTSDQSFGGDWTEAKLQVLRGYLSAYTTALSKTPFRKVYIDAFAGTGDRRPRPGIREPENQGGLFPDLAAHPPQELLAGSARIALECEPSFDEYRFIERDEHRCSALADLAREFPDRESRVIIRPGDANDVRIKATVDEIGHFFLDRLRTVFPGVAEEPGVLRNSRNSPLYLFCFAAANERGAPIALRIAAHLLQELR